MLPLTGLPSTVMALTPFPDGRVLHNNFIGYPAPDAAQGKAVHLVRDAGVDLQPASVGWMPRMYWLTSTNVQAAVPVSQLFFASPKVAASRPATIWL